MPTYRTYDIESLRNIFTVAVYEEGTALEVYYLCDDDLSFNGDAALAEAIREANPQLGIDASRMGFYDLSDVRGFARLANEFGLCPHGATLHLHQGHVGVTESKQTVCYGADVEIPTVATSAPTSGPADAFVHPMLRDTDPDYDEDSSYFLLGFNSHNYDMTMLAEFANHCVVLGSEVDDSDWYSAEIDSSRCVNLEYRPCQARDMRILNDELFRLEGEEPGDDGRRKTMRSHLWENHSNAILWYRAMEMTGRNVDVLRVGLDTKLRALKRIAGMLGYQILESSHLDAGSDLLQDAAEVRELIAYNASDVRVTKKVFDDPNFSGKFEVKSELLETYPDLVYQSYDNGARDPRNVRPKRLYRDSTNQQLTAKTLCPDGELEDYRILSYMYPDETNATAGNPPSDALDDTIAFFERTVASFESLPGEDPAEVEGRRTRALGTLGHVFRMYARLRGKNFDMSDKQTKRRQADDRLFESVIDAYHDACAARDKVLRDQSNPVDYPLLGRTACAVVEQVNAVDQRYQQSVWLACRAAYDVASAFPTACIADQRAYDDAVRTALSLYGQYAEVLRTMSAQTGLPIPDADWLVQVDTGRFDPSLVPMPWTYETYDSAKLVPRTHENGPLDAYLGFVPYYDRYGRPTSGYAQFSVGGVHGAEYDLARYERDVDEFVRLRSDLAYLRETYGDTPEGALAFYQENDRLIVSAHPGLKAAMRRALPVAVPLPSGHPLPVKSYLKSNCSGKRAEWRDGMPAKPTLELLLDNGDTKFNEAYGYTSVDFVNHEDFSSYYPSLLDMMAAFRNPHLAVNRYHDIYVAKEEYGRQRDALPKGDPRARKINIKRNGVKLQLNAATGAGDAKFDNPVRMNNRILSMRIIGQLYSWRIGQAQASAGARVVSTNTDGLYTILDADLNQHILDREKASIGVRIDPEQLCLISKDTNNRVEWKPDADSPHGYRILSGGGGDLTHWQGPNPTKDLAHPAAVDMVLAHYLVRTAMRGGERAFSESFDEALAMDLLNELVAGDPNRALVMLGLMVSASPSKMSYPFGQRIADGEIVYLGHYTRLYAIADKDAPDALTAVRAVGSLAAARNAPPVGDKAAALAEKVLLHNGVTKDDLMGARRYPAISAISGLPKDMPVIVENHSVREMPADEASLLLSRLDLPWYCSLVRSKWEKGWRNK